ncbi:hypothetical protein [Spirosoma litoris]
MNVEAPIQEPIREDWQADLENQKNVSLDDLKFIFAQAEKRLDDGIKNFDATTTKSISFISLTATLLTALTAYFFANHDPQGVFSPKLFTVFCCCLYTFFVLYRFVRIVLPTSYQPIGSYPQDLYQDKFFTDQIKEKSKTISLSTVYLYLGELENYNCRIHHNSEANKVRLAIFNNSTKLMIFMPAVGMTIYSVVLLLSPLF